MPIPVNNPVQDFGVTPEDVAQRVAGMSLSARAIGPDLAGMARVIREVASTVCGVLQGQRIVIPSRLEDNEILWYNARSAVVSGAAARIVSSRNAGADPRMAGTLLREHNDFIDMAITAGVRTGQAPDAPGPQGVNLGKRHRRGYTSFGGGL